MGKDKRRNSEKRKEKSRDAARCRRGKETEVFTELAQTLPVQESVRAQLDKASVMRLAISDLKIRNLMQPVKGVKKSHVGLSDASQKVDQLLYQKALDGFAFILSQDGDIVYLTESVTKHLGLQQLELMGQSLYEFTHPCDHDEVKEVLASTPNKSNNKDETLRTFFLRMKCTLTSKGRNVNLKSASYKVMKCCGRVESCQVMLGDATSSPKQQEYLVGVAEPLTQPSNMEIPLDSKTFVSKHSMDMHFTYCDDRIEALAGYTSEFLMEKSLFSFHHALDSEVLEKAFKDLFSKGQTMTGAYRFLARHGGYVWVVTQATVVTNSRTHKAQSVDCMHFVLSGVEETDQIVSEVQSSPPAGTGLSSLLPPKVELSTENIFAPRTKDMDKAYFVPVELKGTVTFCNNEPEDLSYLAPNAGDESVQLSFSTLGQTLLSPVEHPALKQEPVTAPSTPDMAYRKDTSPGLPLSSNSSSRISSPSDYLSLAMPGDVEAMDQFFQTISTGEKSGALEHADIDFDVRAPYIPMDGEEDLGLLPPSSNLLFNLTPDVNPGLFGRTEDVFGSKQNLFEESSPLKRSVRDMLGGSTAVASIEQPPDTMYLQLKRPLDMNSLEKGPPPLKALRLDTQPTSGPGTSSLQQQTKTLPGIESNKASVLMNLLTRGEDRNYGYKVQPLVPQPTAAASRRASSELFASLTHHDCEVNAPAPSANLLEGRELLRALDVVTLKNWGRVVLQ